MGLYYFLTYAFWDKVQAVLLVVCWLASCVAVARWAIKKSPN